MHTLSVEENLEGPIRVTRPLAQAPRHVARGDPVPTRYAKGITIMTGQKRKTLLSRIGIGCSTERGEQ
jgi:hypothetical protein